MRGKALKWGTTFAAVVVAIAMTVGLAGCGGSGGATGGATSGTSSEPIKIGAIVSLTGTYAGIGTPQKQVIEMEAKRINDAGGINGRKIEVLIEDDGTDEAKAVAAVTKLIDQDKVVAILGTSGTSTTMAIRTAVDKAGIPQVSMAGGNAVTGKFDPLVFQTAWSNALVIPYELAYMKKKGITKIGLISDSGGYGKDGKSLVESSAAEFGITVTSNETFNVGDADMTAQLTKIKNSGAQAVVMWTAGKEAVTVVKNAKALGLTIPVYGSHGNARLEFAKGVGADGDGFLFGAGHVLVPSTYGTDTPEFKVATEFIDNFKKASGATPSTFAGHAYDALYIITDAAKKVDGELTSAKLRDQIEKTSGFNGIGGVFTFGAKDHNGLTDKDLSFYEVKGGQFELAPQ
jgi:branched-chain amino acid transport system substrate-binding protein